MIDKFQTNPKTKNLVVKNDGLMNLIGEDQGKGKKIKLIDIAMGDFNEIVNDLRSQGYKVKEM